MYDYASRGPKHFALDLHMYFSTLCIHLGAKEAIIDQIDLRIRSGTTSLEVTGESRAASTHVPFESEHRRTSVHRCNFENSSREAHRTLPPQNNSCGLPASGPSRA